MNNLKTNLKTFIDLIWNSGMTIYDFDKHGKVCGHTQAYDRFGFLAQMSVLGGLR